MKPRNKRMYAELIKYHNILINNGTRRGQVNRKLLGMAGCQTSKIRGYARKRGIVYWR